MFGAKKYDRMRHYVAMSIYLMAAFSIAMTIGFCIANGPILRLMNTPDEVFGDVKAYMGIIYAGLIVTGAYNALAAFLRALGDSKSPLYFLIISAVINVILDIVFIACLGMGVEGCGYATVIAQGISALCCLFYISKRFPLLHLEKKNFGIAWGSFARLLKLGIPMGLQFSLQLLEPSLYRGPSMCTARYIWQGSRQQERSRMFLPQYSHLSVRLSPLMWGRTVVQERWTG